MAGRKGTTHLAARIRGYFNTAINSLEKKGKSLDKIIEEELEKDFNKTIQTLSKFIPVEIQAETEVRHVIEMTDEQLLEHLTKAGSGRTTKAQGGKKKPPGVH